MGCRDWIVDTRWSKEDFGLVLDSRIFWDIRGPKREFGVVSYRFWPDPCSLRCSAAVDYIRVTVTGRPFDEGMILNSFLCCNSCVTLILDIGSLPVHTSFVCGRMDVVYPPRCQLQHQLVMSPANATPCYGSLKVFCQVVFEPPVDITPRNLLKSSQHYSRPSLSGLLHG